MHYLFESEHFLFRRMMPRKSEQMPELLLAESRTTGAPAGEVLVNPLPGRPGKLETRCRLYGDFQKKKL